MSRLTNSDLSILKQELENKIKIANGLIENLKERETQYEELFSKVNTHWATVNQNVEKINTQAQGANVNFTKIKDLLGSAQAHHTEINEINTNSSEISTYINDQVSNLENLIEKSAKLNKTIEDLLPGATSAGLATAFRERKESFKWPIRIWSTVFIFAIVALFIVAYLDPLTFDKGTFNHETIFAYLFVRLPFAIPIVWLAIYSGRRHSQVLRLEEDYAHKEALSKSFEGYKTQLSEIESEVEEKKAILNLIERTLYAISLHPGRIYKEQHDDVSHFKTLNELLNFKKKPESES